MSDRVLVTGGSGFLGSHVCNELTKRGYRVTIFDKKKSQSLKSKQKVVIGKLSNIKLLEKLVKKDKNRKVIIKYITVNFNLEKYNTK